MDAGGLAQMTISGLPVTGTLGVPGSGYASRGKGSHIKRLSMAPTASQVSGLAESPVNDHPSSLPRTSRSHLLAGLRTAPKTASGPPSAPLAQFHQDMALGGAIGMSGHPHYNNARAMPQTAAATGFPAYVSSPLSLNPLNVGRQMYSLPEQVLAPPAINFGGGPGEEQMDPQLYAELVATNLYLAQQQQRLQQQLIQVTAAAQQFQGLSINTPTGYADDRQAYMSPVSPGGGFYADSSSMGTQPVMTPQPTAFPLGVPVNEGQDVHQARYRSSPPRHELETRRAQPNTPRFKPQLSPPTLSQAHSNNLSRESTPHLVASPTQMSPSFPPSAANALRGSHKKVSSLVSCTNANSSAYGPEMNSPLAPKTAGIPSTPLTGTFGPGQGRAGDHPVRQPRGPPPLEELTAAPTSKHEGSKNFATRQRRRAVHSLVRAGIERRGGRGNSSTGSAGNTTPASEMDASPSDTVFPGTMMQLFG